jgi:(p)ppGpp synthase/HD superfamily hydrolase
MTTCTQQSSLGLRSAAWKFAAQKHHGQYYPGSDLPYLLHIGLVVLALLPALEDESGLDSDLAVCCALLHDVVEDAGTDAEELKAVFGQAITSGVLALSKNGSLPKDEAMRDSLARIRREPREVWLVKLADRIANLDTPPAHWNREKCLSYALEAQMILDSLGGASPLLAATLASRIAAWRDGACSPCKPQFTAKA